MKKKEFNRQFRDSVIGDREEHDYSESPVVDGQALTGAEIFRRQSAGLPVGCAVRSFNKVNPYLDKFQVYDNIGAFRLRHGMLDNTMIEEPPAEQKKTEQPAEQTE